VLGKTIGEIAWQKGGIFKEGVLAITVNQPQEGMNVLRQRSVDLKASEFIVVPPMPELSDIPLGLAGTHQITNAGLAVTLSQRFLELKESIVPQKSLSDTFIEGLKATRWPGRCQTVSDPNYPPLVWFLDGAHTTESLQCCIEWFVSPIAALRTVSERVNPTRILIFNCTHGRSGPLFLETILATIAAQLQLHGSGEISHTFFKKVMFCTNITYADGHFKGDLTAVTVEKDDLKTQQELADAWTSLVPSFPKEHVHVLPSVEHAVSIAREEANKGRPVEVLVTGSLHLIGGLIEVAGLSDVAL